ncbi:cation acetate symporter [Arthrobacter sp. ISL-30]|uniref:sodium/solute symporter n=1 Tax=Arthrobacter sp. ISL-30 TaxID=2819109 RepID=UPI001BE7949A|nr:cation acetate symporter [Arthrobacter sp. ISL-30]MBT2513125.1 cation acetate symporter [Arthrobacter sp. ISL-30]
MNPAVGFAAFIAVSLATAAIGFYGLRISRTTGDFYVASRTVKPWWNASAIGGEYLSAASFLGVAGLILLSGTDALWFPVGYTAGYLMLLLFVAAPLRRSGAYTIPDFTEARLDSKAVRRVTSFVVVAVGWLYIVPQLHGAALTIRITTGLPSWLGSVAVVVVVCLTVVAGGMRSITFVQAFQYWLKLTALAVPVVFVLLALAGNGVPAVSQPGTNPTSLPAAGAYQNISLMVALLFGTLGLPHVLVRFYTNPDGRSARRTTLIVLGLLSVFYLFPTASGLVGRVFAPELARNGQADALVLLLPGRLVGGTAGELLSALVVAGAFAAFLSTTSGLVVSLAGVISQDLLGSSVRGFRLAALLAAVVPLGFAFLTDSFALAGSVGLVFAFTASTICPVLLLGIWWRGLTDAGAITGMVTGALLCGGAMVTGTVLGAASAPGWLAQPAAWTVPTAFAVMVLVSLATKNRVSPSAGRIMSRLHIPERPVATERSPR